MSFATEFIDAMCYVIVGIFVMLLTVVYVKFIEWLSPDPKPVIPRPPKMKRQICDQQVDKSTEPPIIRPLLWATEPIVENPILVPLLPEELKSNCIQAYGHVNEENLALCLRRAFKDLGLSYTQEKSVYRWDVRRLDPDPRLDTILEVRIFQTESGQLTVYFKKHYGYDSMIAYRLFDQIARNAYLDIIVSTNPLTVMDIW